MRSILLLGHLRQGGRGGAPAGPDGALHVAGDPLVGAADVERRLVGAVQRADRLDVARPPVGDVALGPRVGAPQPGPGLQRRRSPPGRSSSAICASASRVRVSRVGGREGGVPLGRDQRRQHAVLLRPGRAEHALALGQRVLAARRARTARRTPPRTWPPTRAAAAAATSAGPR